MVCKDCGCECCNINPDCECMHDGSDPNGKNWVTVQSEAMKYPHMMYDPKTGKGYKAKNEADHNRMQKMGYTHDKPTVSEGTWALPRTSKQKQQLKALMRKPIKFGKDGDEAAGKLYNLIGDDHLMDDLYTDGKKNPNGDARPLVKAAMKRLRIKEGKDAVSLYLGLGRKKARRKSPVQVYYAKNNPHNLGKPRINPGVAGQRAASADDVHREKLRHTSTLRPLTDIEKKKWKDLHGTEFKEAKLDEIKANRPRAGGSKAIDTNVKIHNHLIKHYVDNHGHDNERASKLAYNDIMDMKPKDKKNYLKTITEGGMKRIATGGGLDTFKAHPSADRPADLKLGVGPNNQTPSPRPPTVNKKVFNPKQKGRKFGSAVTTLIRKPKKVTSKKRPDTVKSLLRKLYNSVDYNPMEHGRLMEQLQVAVSFSRKDPDNLIENVTSTFTALHPELLQLFQTEENLAEALNLMQRMKRRLLMKKIRVKLNRGRKLARRKMADPKKLKRRAQRAARNAMIRKITKGKSRHDISAAVKRTIETRLATPGMRNKLLRIQKRLFPKIRKAEMLRRKSAPGLQHGSGQRKGSSGVPGGVKRKHSVA